MRYGCRCSTWIPREAELREAGQEIVASTPELTVLDTALQPGGSSSSSEEKGEEGSGGHGWLRSLHFNDRVDLVQSCVYVRPSLNYADGNSVSSSGPWCPPADRVVDHAAPPPAEGDTATHLNALLAAVGYQKPPQPAQQPPCSPHTQSAPLALSAWRCSAGRLHALRSHGGTDRDAEVDIVERSGGGGSGEHYGSLEEQAKRRRERRSCRRTRRRQVASACTNGWLGERRGSCDQAYGPWQRTT